MGEFKELEGQTLQGIYGDNECLVFCTENHRYTMQHHYNCCESVLIEEVHGALEFPCYVTTAEESTQDISGNDNSTLWTFYRILTPRGDLTIRWLGRSNGYYSVSVSFTQDDQADASHLWVPSN